MYLPIYQFGIEFRVMIPTFNNRETTAVVLVGSGNPTIITLDLKTTFNANDLEQIAAGMNELEELSSSWQGGYISGG